MDKYEISHLKQKPSQEVLGPIQDDEALLLYSVIRTMRLHNIIEIGGLYGYSATNFSKAVVDGKIYTVDINPCPKIAENHIVIQKDCRLITKKDVPDKIDMIFFDAHVYEEQVEFFEALLSHGIIDDEVVLSFHDTNLHPNKVCNSYYLPNEGGWCHQPVERRLVDHFKIKGFDAICFHTKLDEHTIPFRHGITIMKKYKKLNT
jgi:predicted O-methyltransferase YrrM